MKWKGKKRYASNFCGHLGWRGGLILGTVEMCWGEGKPPIVCQTPGARMTALCASHQALFIRRQNNQNKLTSSCVMS